MASKTKFRVMLIISGIALITSTMGHIKKGVAEDNPGSDRFAICTATLDGENMTKIISDPYRQMTHVRVSPDKKWIAFTRYNKRRQGGIATEKDGYDETEIMLIRLDGTGLKSLIPPRKGIVACNSYWTPDGKALLYVSTDNPGRRPQIKRLYLNNNMEIQNITTLPVPENLLPVDPHQVGNLIVFPAINIIARDRGIWIMNADGTDLRQLTYPKEDPEGKDPIARHKAGTGDNDPKLSPDCSRVAFMRHIERKYHWHIHIVDVKTGEEKDLSAARIPLGCPALDAMPEWSSDGKLLIYWHIDMGVRQVNLYTMKPDGSERKRISLPRGHSYTMGSFFPGEGSGKKARIIFSVEK